jgi:hypothetical protein
LQERADLLAKQIGAIHEQFDRRIEQLKHEHATRLDDLKSGLDTVRLVIRIENHRAGNPFPGGQSRPDLLAREAEVSVR